MSDFQKPTQRTVDISAAWSELIGKKLTKDLHDDEAICPVCRGTGLQITDNPYGLKGDPEHPGVRFPYKHQSLIYCWNCYNGVVHICPYCGKQMKRGWLKCDCNTVKKQEIEEKHRKEQEAFDKAKKHEPDSLGGQFPAACSPWYQYRDGYFENWDDFFEAWAEEHADDERPVYVWVAEEIGMDFAATSIVENACDDLYDDAVQDVDDKGIAEMQTYLDEWRKKYGLSAWTESRRHAIRIPWERFTQSRDKEKG